MFSFLMTYIHSIDVTQLMAYIAAFWLVLLELTQLVSLVDVFEKASLKFVNLWVLICSFDFFNFFILKVIFGWSHGLSCGKEGLLKDTGTFIHSSIQQIFVCVSSVWYSWLFK